MDFSFKSFFKHFTFFDAVKLQNSRLFFSFAENLPNLICTFEESDETDIILDKQIKFKPTETDSMKKGKTCKLTIHNMFMQGNFKHCTMFV